MSLRLFVIILMSAALTACKGIDGVYLPGCSAYAGDRIELRDGNFVWAKFTDQVKVDAAGERVDPFPGYPRTGTYQRNDNEVTMLMAEEGTSATFYLQADDRRLLLLTPAQQASWEASGRHDECALTRTTDN